MRSNPWAQLSRPTQAGLINALRIDPDHPHELFRTRDHKGCIGFSIQFQGEVRLPSALPRLQGFRLWAGGAPVQLRLTLPAESDWELFLALSEDLARTSSSFLDSQQALDSLLARIERWQRLLARDRSGLLTDQELRGLFGELTFLHEELLPRFGSQAVAFWNGPEGAPQDFSIRSLLVEVKTRTGAGPARVHIASPEQLWPSLPMMFLRVYFLAINDAEGLTISDLVSRIRARLDNPEHLALFEGRLDSVGYIDLPDYDATTFSALHPMTYQVGPGFPSIAPSSVPEGISRLSYDLSLDHCRSFVGDIPWTEPGVRP